MKKRLMLLIAMSAAYFFAVAQTQFGISGSVRAHDTNSQLIGATVKVYDNRDSLLDEGVASSRGGDLRGVVSKTSQFYLSIPKIKDYYKLVIAYEDHDTLVQKINLTNMGRREFSRDLGIFYLDRMRHHQLAEVSVTSSKIKFYNKGDTLVYNADAFQLAEGSMLDALIRQLPGVELRDGGRIYVNGEFVESLLLNGRDFFKGDNKLMLDNLAAYTVKDIEVYRKQEFMQEFMGLKGKEDTKLVMDVKIKKEYMGGWTINAEAGGGTNERYLARLFALHFTGTNQISLIGNVNNLNDASSPNSENSWNPATRPVGVQKYREVGINYTLASRDNNRQLNGKIFFRSSDDDYDSRSNNVNFLPSQNIYSNKFTKTDKRNLYFNTLQILDLKTDTWALRIMPRFRYEKTKYERESRSASFDSEQDPKLVEQRIARIMSGRPDASDRDNMINAALSQVYKGDYVSMPGVDIVPTFKVPRTSDFLYMQFSYSHRSHHSSDNSIYAIDYGQSGRQPEWRRQKDRQRPDDKNAFYGEIDYYYTASENLKLTLGYNVDMYHRKIDSNFWVGYLNSVNTGDYTLENLYNVAMDFDPANSYNSLEKIYVHNIEANLRWSKNSWSVYGKLPFTFNNQSLNYLNKDVANRAKFNKAYLGNARANINYYKRSKGGMLKWTMSYSLNQTAPDLIRMIDVPNTTNPLSVSLGNPELRNSTEHSVNTSLYIRQSGEKMYSADLSFGSVRNAIAQGYTYDTSTGVYYYRWDNVDGNFKFGARVGHSRNLVKNLTFDVSASYSYNRSNNMVGENSLTASKITMNTNNLRGGLGLSYTPSKFISLNVGANPDYQHSESSQSGRKLSFFSCVYGARCVLTLPYNWSIRTNLDYYTRSGYNDPALDTNDPIWNARVAKTFGKGRWMVAVDAYDMLHRMKNILYVVTPDCRIEQFTNTIPRYVLFHVQYRINIQPKKKIAQTMEGTWHR